ncbi:SipW-dependent-type signal peptide-containing protein [Mesorhizobium sp.]
MGSGGSNALWSSRNSVTNPFSSNVSVKIGDFY